MDHSAERRFMESGDAARKLANLAVQREHALKRLVDHTLDRHAYRALCDAYDGIQAEYERAVEAYAPFVKEEP